eukprot:357124-Chlamydomonas_euryale.AAC.5
MVPPLVLRFSRKPCSDAGKATAVQHNIAQRKPHASRPALNAQTSSMRTDSQRPPFTTCMRMPWFVSDAAAAVYEDGAHS